jgi:hypothetical protein
MREIGEDGKDEKADWKTPLLGTREGPFSNANIYVLD